MYSNVFIGVHLLQDKDENGENITNIWEWREFDEWIIARQDDGDIFYERSQQPSFLHGENVC